VRIPTGLVGDRQRPRRQPWHPRPGAEDAQRLEPHLPTAGEVVGDGVEAEEVVERGVALPGGDHPHPAEVSRRQQWLAERRGGGRLGVGEAGNSTRPRRLSSTSAASRGPTSAMCTETIMRSGNRIGRPDKRLLSVKKQSLDFMKGSVYSPAQSSSHRERTTRFTGT